MALEGIVTHLLGAGLQIREAVVAVGNDMAPPETAVPASS